MFLGLFMFAVFVDLFIFDEVKVFRNVISW